MKIALEYEHMQNYFNKTEKETRDLTFYSEKAMYYKYFQGFIEYIINNSDLNMCYITSDIDDPIFQKNSRRIKVFYINTLIAAFMSQVDSKVFILTMPDLNQFHIKRSSASDNVNYVYIFHAIVSTHMVYRKGAFDYYDTVFCIGPHHTEEIKKNEEIYRLKKKSLVQVGYPLAERIYNDHQKYLKKISKNSKEKKNVLIAPSWNKDNIIETCIKELTYTLSGSGYNVIIRPHPHYVRIKIRSVKKLIKEFKNKENIKIELDLCSYKSIHWADILITDWSGISFEYVFGTERPVLFIDTPKKVNNPEYEKLAVRPIQIKLRNKIGKVVNINEIYKIHEIVTDLIQNTSGYRNRIIECRNNYIYNWQNSDKVGGKYIINLLSQPE